MIRISGGIKSMTLLGLVAIFLLVAEKPALADSDGTDLTLGPEVVLIGLAILVVEAGMLVGGSVAGVGNLSYVVRGKKAPAAWRIQGYIFGSLNILAAGVLLALASENDNEGMLKMGLIHAGVGAANFTFTIWAQTQDDGSERSLAISPLIIPTEEGRPAFGAGLRLVGW